MRGVVRALRRPPARQYASPVADDTGDQLIRVAREILAKRGYLGLTMKTASAAAGVTPDVAMRYYRNRDALIAAALRLPSDPIAAIPTLVAPGVEGMGERLVRYMLDILRDPQTRAELVSLARTGVNARAHTRRPVNRSGRPTFGVAMQPGSTGLCM